MSVIDTTNIIDTYNKIAIEFSRTRYYIWAGVKEFLDSLQPKSTLADIGCGNGKNMLYRKDLETIGVDLCEGFIQICKEKGLKVIMGSITDIPLESNSIDNVISIAVVHHLNSVELRIKAISELLRIVKPGGFVMISVWSFEQDISSKRQFTSQDEMVPFKLRNGSIEYRYYHLYKKLELDEEVKEVKKISEFSDFKYSITSSFEEKNNYIVIIKKN